MKWIKLLPWIGRNSEAVNIRETLCNLVSRPFDRILPARPMEGAEIGVYKGYHAEDLLRNRHITKLLLVDPYTPYSEEPPGGPLDYAKRRATRLFGQNPRAKLLLVDSAQAAARVPDRSLDFVYIDACHDYQPMKQDLKVWWPKVKRGGLLAGHDFNSTWPSVVKAVAEFAVEHNLPLAVESPDWWITKP